MMRLQEIQDDGHNWKATGIAICAITFVLMAVSTAALLLGAFRPDNEAAFWKRVPYDLHSALDVESSIFVDNSASSDQWKSTRWITDHQLVYWDSSGGLSLYRATTNESIVLVPASITTVQWRTEEYWPSFDGRYVLLRKQPVDTGMSDSFIAHNVQQKEHFYAVYDTQENDLWKLHLKTGELQPVRLSYAGWSGRSNHLLAIHRNNIYWTRDATSRTDWKLRRGGQDNDTIKETDFTYVGLPDWTYSEGITQWKSLMWPSVINGEFLVYAVLDASRCQRLDFIDYLTDHAESSSIRYAVPGGRLPEIQLKLLHLESNAERTLSVSAIANQREMLLVQLEWLMDETSFVTVWISRNQNRTSVFHCPALASSDCIEIIQEEAMADHWSKPPGLFMVSNGGFILASSEAEDQSSRLTYHQPPWDKTVSIDIHHLVVQRVVGWNEANKTTYFLGNTITDPHQRNLYKIIRTEVECLSCDSPADNCNFVDARFDAESSSADFYELQCLGPHIPSVHIIRTEGNETIATLRHIDNDGETRELLEHLTPLVRYLNVPLADGHSTGRAQLLLPRTWNDKMYHHLRFPLIIRTLDWNEDECLTDQWRKEWTTYFTVTRQVIFARVSGRERQSNKYGSIRLAVEDVLTIANFIIAELVHVDDQAIVIIGKGVGGYLALSAMTTTREEQSWIKCGIIMSPTIHWEKHETSVAERYLGDIRDQHYNKHYVLMRMEDAIHRIKNDTLLLMDSFPFNPVEQFQSIKLSQHLIKLGTLFQHMIYPRTGGKMTRYHHHLTLEHFIAQCLHSVN